MSPLTVKNSLIGQYAGFTTRAAAYIVDFLIIYLILVITSWLTVTILESFFFDITACPPWAETPNFANAICYSFRFFLIGFTLLFPFLYTTFFWVFGGQTPGKAMMGIRVVRLDGKRMTFLRSIRRFAGYFLSIFSLGLGFLWVLGNDRRQAWQDIIAGTCVIYAWQATPDENMLVPARTRLNAVLEKIYRDKNPEKLDSG